MKKIILSIYAMILCHSIFSQNMLQGFYLNPLGGNWESYKNMAFGNPDNKWGGFMWNNTNTFYGDGDDFTIYTYSNRDLVLSPGGGNIILNPRNTNGKIGIGITNPNYKLDVNGTVHSKEVRVDVEGFSVPDYVFKEDFDLMTLQKLSEYIEENHHLPNIPSASDFENQGMNLKQMNLLLLQKIEELTLYVLSLQEQVDQLKSKS